jgi:hypothetical protein
MGTRQPQSLPSMLGHVHDKLLEEIAEEVARRQH